MHSCAVKTDDDAGESQVGSVICWDGSYPSATVQHDARLPEAPNRAPKPRVALVLNSIMFGGVEEHVALLSEALPAHGFEPIVFCADTPALTPLTTRLDRLGVRRVSIDLTGGGAGSAVALLARMLKQHRVDLMHTHLIGCDGGRIPLLAGMATRLPIVVTHHLAPDSKAPALRLAARRLFLRGVTGFVAVSEANRQKQIAHMGLSSKSVTCVPNGAAPADPAEDYEAMRRTLRDLFNLDSDCLLVGWVGRMSAQKGADCLLNAALRILQESPRAHFVLIGDGECRSALQHQTEALGISDRVHWTGFRVDAKQLVAGLDVLAMPSRFEGMPYSLLEAMARRVCVVAFAVDGIPEVIDDGVTGFLVPPCDTIMLAATISRVLADPDIRNSVGNKAQMHISSEFSADKNAENLSVIYRNAMKSRSAGPR